ncbi:MAG: glutamyl-tRNA reductase [Candidatus Schekmanbacteria bacterium]|nr:glutamyl-tRNA reductase [Candidatus Schekmanbacteria bacterium]
MEIIIVGLSHKTAPVEIREKISFPEHKLPDALTQLGTFRAIKEGIILSTCNRVEIIAHTDCLEGGSLAIKEFISRFHQIPIPEFESHLYIHHHQKAMQHLFRVACSLDSMIVGEPQILGQLKSAYTTALECKTTGIVLNNLLSRSFSVGKRVRSETGIAKNAVSISFAAVELAKKIFSELSDKTVMVIGTGEMSELVAQHLIGNGVKKVLVTNRTQQRAVEFAEKFQGEAVPYDDYKQEITRADIVIASTGAPHFILHHEDIIKVIHQRKYNPMFFIDIAVPRNIDPKINEIDNVYLYDIDDLDSVVQANIKERQKEAKVAEEMIEQDVTQFANWMSSLDVVPVIVALREKMESIRIQELNKALARLGNLGEKERNALEILTNGIINKILHQPTIALKQQASTDDIHNILDATRKLFDLEGKC